MASTRRYPHRLLLAALTLGFSSHVGLALALPAYGVTATGDLVAFDTDAPATVTIQPITGLVPGEDIVGLDMVVTNGRLYALGDQGRLYTINPASGVAVRVGVATIGLALNGTRFGLDYDPVADVLRVTSNTAQNFRINYTTGLAIDGSPAPGIQGDTNLSPGPPQVAGAAHTNNFDGAGFTRLYVIDSAADNLRYTEGPNGGVLTTVGGLGVNVGTDTSFDIVAENIAYMVAPSGIQTTLYDINLSTGDATAIGTVGNNLIVRAFAVYAPRLTLRAVTSDGLLVRFGNIFPNVLLSQNPITGVQPGESLVGIDFRPTTRELYAVGSSSRLYTVAANGAVTQVGLAPFAIPLEGTHFGVDFDPMSDRLRVISNTGQNLRIHPDTGKVIDADPNTDGVQPDTPINPAGSVVGLAYTNSVPGATESTLFGLEVTQDRFVRIGGVNGTPSANGGVVTNLGPLGVNASAITAFDIAPVGEVGGTGYAAVQAGNASNLHRVTSTGFISEFRPINKQVTAMAIEPAGTVAFTQIFVYVNEGGNAQLVVSRESESGHAFVEYRVTGGTAANGLDYTLPNGVVQFPSGITTATIPLPTLQDPFDEIGETIIVTLEHPSPGLTLGSRDTVVVTIADNDGAANAPPEITILSPNIQVFRAIDGTVNVSGTASDDAAVMFVTWANAENKAAGVATGTTAWTVEGIPLEPGTQFITVTAVDAQGATDSATVEVRAFEGSYYLAEGATGGFFDFDLLLANPNGGAAPVEITFLKPDGTTVQHDIVLAPASRTTIAVDSIGGLEGTEVSAFVQSTSGRPLAVERTMRWDATGYGAHSEKASQSFRGRTWYFAEGSQGFFDTYFLLANPTGAQSTATVEMFLEDGTAAYSQQYVVAAFSRRTIVVNQISALQHQSFWTRITFTGDGIAERAMYFGTPVFNAGHESSAVNATSTAWFHAEGATGGFFTTFILLANPNDVPATLTTTYLPADGTPVTVPRVLPPRTRTTINIALEHPSLANAAVATRVQSDVPILSERSMYWPGDPASWQEAHNSFGVTASGTRWALAEGRVGGPQAYQTYILLANPGIASSTVTINFLRENGTIVEKDYTVPASSRFNVDVNTMVPELSNESFAARIDATAPIVVERALYSNLDGVLWSAGTNATATRLP